MYSHLATSMGPSDEESREISSDRVASGDANKVGNYDNYRDPYEENLMEKETLYDVSLEKQWQMYETELMQLADTNAWDYMDDEETQQWIEDRTPQLSRDQMTNIEEKLKCFFHRYKIPKSNTIEMSVLRRELIVGNNIDLESSMEHLTPLQRGKIMENLFKSTSRRTLELADLLEMILHFQDYFQRLRVARKQIVAQQKNQHHLQRQPHQVKSILTSMQNLSDREGRHSSRATLLLDSNPTKNISYIHLIKLKLQEIPSLFFDQFKSSFGVILELDLSCNQLHELTHQVTQLCNLKRLNLQHNQLTILPHSIGALKSLRELNISWNKLSTLPDSLGDLELLKHLNVANNCLTHLPYQLIQCLSLRTLIFEPNPSMHVQIPWEMKENGILGLFCYLKSLHTCNYSNPFTLGNANEIQHQQLTAHKVFYRMQIIEGMVEKSWKENLVSRMFDLNSIGLNSWSRQECELPLQKLWTQSEKNFAGERHAPIDCLLLSNNSFGVLPSSFYLFPGFYTIKVLDLSMNKLQEIDAAIAELHFLQNLDVSHNKIHTLPDNLINCRRLTQLNVFDNDITSISDAMRAFIDKKLEIFIPHQNPFHDKVFAKKEDDADQTGLKPLNRIVSLFPLHLDDNDENKDTVEWKGKCQFTVTKNFLHELKEKSNRCIVSEFIELSNYQFESWFHSATYQNIKDFAPSEIMALVHIKDLDLSYNSISYVPVEIRQMTKLRRFAASHNKITEKDFEHSLGKCRYLENLDLSNNQIHSIDMLDQLPALQLINVANNQIEAISTRFYENPGIRQIYLHGNTKISVYEQKKAANNRT